jgi:NADPH:quinone reductase-like Zn-dependent oxidoreductase
MRIYRLQKIGSIDGLVASEEAIPTPGAGEVLVKVQASSLNFRDFVLVNGWFPVPVPPGRVPLSDGAGEVQEVGAGVNRFKAGDRVVNAFFPNWFAGSFNAMPEQYVIDHDGWLTQYKVLSAEALASLPDYLTYEEGATLPCAGVTAWSALAGVGAGDTVLTQGTGGVSIFAIQLAKAMGARVIATTSSAAKADKLRRLGADQVIDYKANPAWGEEARKLTSGRGVDRIVDVGGPGSLPQSVKAVAYGGQVSLVGVLGGAEGGLQFMSMFLSLARYQPIVVGSRRDLEDLIRVMSRHHVKPVIDSVFDFADFRKAWDRYVARQLFGKVVVRH